MGERCPALRTLRHAEFPALVFCGTPEVLKKKGPTNTALRAGFRDLGYVEGHNINFDDRLSQRDARAIPEHGCRAGVAQGRRVGDRWDPDRAIRERCDHLNSSGVRIRPGPCWE